jgi:ribosomal protein S21
MQVIVFENNIEEAIRKFKKKVSESGLLKEVKRRSFSLGKSERRRQKDLVALRRLNRKKARVRRFKGNV